MKVLHEMYGLSIGDCRYRNKLKNCIKEKFTDKLHFATVGINNSEVVISRSVLENTIQPSFHDNAIIKESALKDILEHSERHLRTSEKSTRTAMASLY